MTFACQSALHARRRTRHAPPGTRRRWGVWDRSRFRSIGDALRGTVLRHRSLHRTVSCSVRPRRWRPNRSFPLRADAAARRTTDARHRPHHASARRDRRRIGRDRCGSWFWRLVGRVWSSEFVVSSSVRSSGPETTNRAADGRPELVASGWVVASARGVPKVERTGTSGRDSQRHNGTTSMPLLSSTEL